MRKALLILFLAAPSAATEFLTWTDYAESLPPLEALSHESTYTLRVLYLEDPRLPGPSARERKRLYRKIEILLNAWYSFKVDVKEVRKENLFERFSNDADLFETKKARDFMKANALTISGFGAKDEILKIIQEDLKRRDEKIIRRYVNLRRGATKRDALNAVYAVFEDRLSRLRNTRVGEDDSETLFNKDSAITQSFPHWEIFLSELKEADFVLTNSVIAGPDADMPLYVSIRGGITNGFVTNSTHNAYHAVGVVAMFPFLSDSPFFMQERGKLRSKMDVLATFWMHELGHFFLRMKEHYGEAGCVHVAPEGLRVYEWHRAIRKTSNRCRYLPEERLTLF
ncbi:MAG: hypothetical protein COB53_02110 [Elusimicrobia bacterium]|nr:MAG: hypothetical protein COB53_02110 [Elusimicrobiota bacterium]